MNFLHPWAIVIGLLGMALPLVIHYLTRPRPKSMPLSTIRFVRDAVKQRQSRSKLRDGLVLLCRSLAIGLLALAFAQPLFNAEPTDVSTDSTRLRRIVILDVSQSMAATDGSVGRFQLAKVQAKRFLNSESGLKANLVLAGAQPKAVFEQASANVKVLNDALVEAKAKPEHVDVQAALSMASTMLAGDDPETELEVVVVSDFQRSNWAAVDFSILPEKAKIQLESVAEADAMLANVAIESVRFLEQPTVGAPVTLEVQVGNFSKAARNVKVEALIGPALVSLEGGCPAGRSTLLTAEVALPSTGWQVGWASIVDNLDALPVDDRFPFVVQSIDSPGIAVVTKQSPRKIPSSSYFVQTALQPFSEQADSRVRVGRIATNRFSVEQAAGYQRFVLDHPGKMETAQIRSLASLIRRGRGILYFASEAIDATNLKLLAAELGSDWQAPVELMPAARSRPRRDLQVQSMQESRRPFSIFGDSLMAQLSSLRISGGLGSRRVPNSLDDDILATLSDQSVFVYSCPVGLGKLSVVNVDLEACEWSRHASFLPIVNELVDDLLSSSNRAQLSLTGLPLVKVLPSEVSSADGLVVSQSEGEGAPEVIGQLQTSGDGVVWSCKELPGPDIFEIEKDGKSVFALAANLSPEESDLRTLDASLFEDRLSGGRDVSFTRVTGEKREEDRSWIWLAVAAVVALIGEVAILKGFRS